MEDNVKIIRIKSKNKPRGERFLIAVQEENEGTNRHEWGKCVTGLLKHLGIAALRGWKGDTEGGEGKGAILTTIQNGARFSFVRAVFSSLSSSFAFLSLCDYDGRVCVCVCGEGGSSDPSFCWCEGQKNCVILRPRGFCCVCAWEREREV